MFNNKVQRYSIRKLTVGAASVLIGMAFLTNSNQAKADTVNDQADGSNDAKAVTEAKQNISTTSAQDLQKVVVEKADTANTNDQAATTEKATDDSAAEKATQTLQVSKEKSNAPETVSADSLADSKAEVKTQTQNNNKQQPTVKAVDEKKDSTTDPKQETHKVTVNFIDDYTGKPIYTLNRSKWAYEYVPTFSGDFKDGQVLQTYHDAVDANGKPYQATTRVNTYYNVPGFVLLNKSEIDKSFTKFDNYGDPVMSGDKDINLTLHYAPLADTYIKYVDEDTGKTLAHVTFPNSRLNVADPQKGVLAARYEAAAINIPGYELVSDPYIEGQVQPNQIKTKDNDNPTVLVFKYKKVTPNEIPESISKSNEGGIALSTTAWGALPGMFTTTFDPKTKGTITTDGRDVEKASSDLINRYEKQGFTYAGTSGKILSSDPYNSVYDGTNIHLIPNLPVTVSYVDEAGNKLAADTTLAFNKNNPDQTNNGINDKENWHPEGEWQSKPKDIKGYDLVKTLGSENGKFTLFTYNVTYVYGKHVNGNITYIDDTDKKNLASDGFEGTAGKSIDYTTADKIANYEKQGYELVSNNFNDGKEIFAEDGNTFEVHLAHKTEEKKDSKTITRTVNYVDENGNPVANSVTETATLNGSATLDKVTNKVSDYKWNTSDFKEVNTPSVDNYHVTGVTTEGNLYYNVDQNNGNVAATTVTNKDGNTVVTVHFAKDDAKGTVTFIDDTTNSTLKTDDLNGKVGDKIDYTTQDKIANYEKQGYELVSNNFKDGNETFAKDGNKFEIHLAHKTEEKKNSKTITRTVNYVDENGNAVAKSVTQTVTVNGQGTVDQVTGKYTKPMTWTEDNFAEVDTPSVKDYHVTGVTSDGNLFYSVDQKNGNVSSTKVTKDNGNTVVTVHFAKDQTPAPQPSNPDVTPTPNPSNPSNPTQPTETVTPQPETPETPQTPETPSDNEETVTPHATDVPEDNDDNNDNTEETVRPHAAAMPEKQVAKKNGAAVVKTAAKAEAQTLPQTGEENDDAAAAAGLAMFSAISLIGLAGLRKHED